MSFSVEIKNIIQDHVSVAELVLQDHQLLENVDEFTKKVIECYNRDNKILLCGNGGSASDAQHIAAEWQGRYLLDRKPLHAEALHANTSYITAVGNDYGFEHIYSRAVEAQGRNGDILIGLSTSGNSPNIVEALKQGRSRNMFCIGMTGNKTDTAMEEYCDLMIKVPSGITARIQEMHILIGHIVCELSEKHLFGEKS